jgi:hypothetical protein
MAKPDLNSLFTRYNFDSEEELLVASTLTDLQRKYIQSELSIVAEKKMRIALTPGQEDMFIKEHEYMRGSMDILQYLLQTSDDNQNAVIAAMQEAAETQQRNS